MAKNFISLFVQKACVQLGFPGAKRPTHSSQFGYGLEKIWMDNMHCYGTEDTLTDCRYFIKISLMVSYFYYYVKFSQIENHFLSLKIPYHS